MDHLGEFVEFAEYGGCWNRAGCPEFYEGDQVCNLNCRHFQLTKAMKEESRLPVAAWYPLELKALPTEKEAFRLLSRIKTYIMQFVEEGQSLMIYGNESGTGKTSWAIKLLNTYIEQYWPYYDYSPCVKFFHVPTIISQMKYLFTFPDEKLYSEIFNHIEDYELVVFDDIACNVPTKFESEILLSLIERRALAGKSSIFTTNLNHDETVSLLGNRLADRIWSGVIVTMPNNLPTRRKGQHDWTPNVK